MSVRNVLARELARSGGSARLVKIPEDKRPTAESLENLRREIGAQLRQNDAMRQRSMENYGRCKTYSRRK